MAQGAIRALQILSILVAFTVVSAPAQAVWQCETEDGRTVLKSSPELETCEWIGEGSSAGGEAPSLKPETWRDGLSAEDRACSEDLDCWAEENYYHADYRCGSQIEALARYDHRWTTGWTGSRFSRMVWSDREQGHITYLGDNIEFKNGLGNWIPHQYACTLDTQNERVIDVYAEPGRLN